MSATLNLNPVGYVVRLNQLRRVAATAVQKNEPWLYVTILKSAIPKTWRAYLGDHRGPIGEVTQVTPVDGLAAVSLRFKPRAVLNWCIDEAERLSK
jgi:hypothetical protein